MQIVSFGVELQWPWSDAYFLQNFFGAELLVYSKIQPIKFSIKSHKTILASLNRLNIFMRLVPDQLALEYFKANKVTGYLIEATLGRINS